jgi:hypothetical protein
MNVEIAIGIGTTSPCSIKGHRNKGCPLAISIKQDLYASIHHMLAGPLESPVSFV